MRIRLLLLAPVAAAVVLGSTYAVAQEDKGGPLRPRPGPDDGVMWIDVDGEAAYQVSGHVSYLPPPSCINRLEIPGESFEFSEELPADTTSFKLPLPNDSRLTWRKDVQFTIEALDPSGERVALDGFASTGDQFCTPEQIAEELAAAGTGFEPGHWPLAQLAALLAAAGAVLTAGGWFLRRRAS